VSTTPTGSVEREIKLGARPGFSMPELTDVAPGVTVVAETALDLDATYVDTADLQLVRNGVSLRRRTGDGAPRWTLKLPSAESGAGLARREFDVDDAGSVVPAGLASLVTGWVRAAPLVPVVVIHSHRERLRLLDPDGRELAEIDDDEVSVLDDGHVAARFREVEVEMAEHGSSDLLHLVSDALVAAGAGAPDPTSKVARALGPRALVPPDLTPPEIDAGSSTADLVTSALRRSVDRIVANDHVIRLDDDTDGVRRYRAGVRRLRSDLQTLGPVLEPDRVDGLRSRLKELAAALGVVRGPDALVERLLRSVGALPAADRPIAILVVGRLDDERRAGMDALLALLADDAYVVLLDELVDAASQPGLSDAARGPAAECVPALVRPHWRRLRQAVEHLAPEPDDESLGGVRVLVKRARHATELAAPVEGEAAAALASGMADLQHVLGQLRDAVEAEAWLGGVLPALGPDELRAAEGLIALQQADAAAARSAWRDAWEACDRRSLTRWLG
jgi:CHAD domain-containing protein